jgi:pyruvate/2-oxoglutarate/acetoin dehydrogenase E1 component
MMNQAIREAAPIILMETKRLHQHRKALAIEKLISIRFGSGPGTSTDNIKQIHGI